MWHSILQILTAISANLCPWKEIKKKNENLGQKLMNFNEFWTSAESLNNDNYKYTSTSGAMKLIIIHTILFYFEWVIYEKPLDQLILTLISLLFKLILMYSTVVVITACVRKCTQMILNNNFQIVITRNSIRRNFNTRQQQRIWYKQYFSTQTRP